MALDRPQDALLYLQQMMVEAEVHPIAGGHAGVFSTRSPAKQTPNEDAAALLPFDSASCVLLVADGVGGVAAGEQASQLAMQSLLQSVESAAEQGWMPRTAILNGVETANQAVCDLNLGAATTLAAVEVQGSTIRPYHIGDSIILVVGQRGKIKFESVSHSPVGYAVAAGMLDQQQAMHHADRHLVSNVLGTPDMWIDVGPSIELSPRDTLLIASDGLLDNLHVEEIAEYIRKGPLHRSLTRLAEFARRRMTAPEPGEPSKPDDLTFVAFRRA